MTLEELKTYIVKVNGGSGCLFQPIQSEMNYTYILTAKHLFEGTKNDEDGIKIPFKITDGTEIQIFRQKNVGGKWNEVIVSFVLNYGETYFPHKDADAAILKVTPSLNGFDRIIAADLLDEVKGFALYGFPNQFKSRGPGEKDTSYSIRELELPSQFLQNAQLNNDTLNKSQIEGMSGSGILSIQNENIFIIGVQSEMKHAVWANGKICFVPIKYFSEIIEYDEYKEKLTKLHPPFMGTFDFLRDEAFALEVDYINENKIESTRIHLRNKAIDIVNSDITPLAIKELLKKRLLIDESEINSLETKNIWIGWLEFLTILNIVKNDNLSIDKLNDIFNNYRLKYTHIDDCTRLFQDHLSKSDYLGLKQGGMVVINSKVAPKKPFHIPVGGMVKNITRPQDKKGFRTDKEMDPFQSFSFIHLDFFKTDKIINKMDEYQNLSEIQLLEKLKQEYHDLFQ